MNELIHIGNSDISNRHIYAAEFSNGNIKIGTSMNVEKRIDALEYQIGCKCLQYYSTDICQNCFEVERDVHDALRNYKTYGEWFSCKYEDAVNCLANTYSEKSRRTCKTMNTELTARQILAYFHGEAIPSE